MEQRPDQLRDPGITKGPGFEVGGGLNINRDDGQGQSPPGGPVEDPPLGFLDLIYGVLFDPRVTFRRVALQPPIGPAIFIFTLVNLVGATMGVFAGYRLAIHGPGTPGMHMAWLMQAAGPVMAATGLIFQYLKWLVVSAVMHFAAELFGGRGRAVGILSVTALASLPALVLAPVDLILLSLGARGLSVAGIVALTGLGSFVWSVILVVLGLREVYGFSTGRAILAVFLPPAVLVVAGIILLGVFGVIISSLAPMAGFPW